MAMLAVPAMGGSLRGVKQQANHTEQALPRVADRPWDAPDTIG